MEPTSAYRYVPLRKEASEFRILELLRTPLETDALIELFERPWFRRVWVVQEIAVATKARLVCGPEEMNLLGLLNIVAWLSAYHLFSISPELNAAMWNVYLLFDARSNFSHSSYLTLFDRLQHTRDLLATDPRDKVFGMLGLLEPQTASQLMHPDYTKSVSAVYQDAVRQCVAVSHMPLWLVDLISHRDESDLTDDCPSWVPRFDRAYDGDLDCHPFDHGTLHGIGRVELLATAAKVGANEPGILVLPGLEICRIVEVSALFDSSTSQDLALLQAEAIASWFETATTMLQDHGIVGSTAADATAARIIVADNLDTPTQCPEGSFDRLVALLQHVQHHPSAAAFGNRDSADASLREASKFCDKIIVACQMRRLAIMRNGTAGLVPKLVQPSDRVVMIHGSNMPFVIRPCGEEYLLLGDCYLDGWMSWQEKYTALEQRMLKEEPINFRIR
ncbi:unnamed protein product [Zymoseptoria tritici ST99CH_1E4]|uniref:Heterokaryon incompatibility domain-containing protein n=1 Tax=Zymoseptoria tritici ST99CH_1E4 TaxID=1276532 RepID=A0A2H1GXI2_ZYMTR|nr:unnamed protein product [Zymoseptoria tritici ST99CH_1E4]